MATVVEVRRRRGSCSSCWLRHAVVLLDDAGVADGSWLMSHTNNDEAQIEWKLSKLLPAQALKSNAAVADAAAVVACGYSLVVDVHVHRACSGS